MQDFTQYNPNPGRVSVSALSSFEALFFQRVYAWMCAGLALTAATAFILSRSQAWISFLHGNSFAFIGILVIQFGLVWQLGSRLDRLSPGAARGLFLAYSAVTGATFSALLLVYPPAAFIKAFVCAAGIYGAMAFYGLVTKRSLQGLGGFMFMGLVGLILAMVMNLFVQSARLDLTICVIGVLIFSGLTAYDHQKLQVLHYSLSQEGGPGGIYGFPVDEESRLVIRGALTLYLDFINIFVLLLRLLGSSRD